MLMRSRAAAAGGKWRLAYIALGVVATANALMYVIEWLSPYEFDPSVKESALGAFFVAYVLKLATDAVRRDRVDVRFDDVDGKLDDVGGTTDVMLEAVFDLRDALTSTGIVAPHLRAVPDGERHLSHARTTSER